ncbi:hypothetical protein [Streptomyces sp. NPDC090022]|uniref:hypothetical protein n=1 Tax=Streptomyces sp. NPDC090022 TaxID=3365920 RepID=UPI0038291BF9
MPSPRAPAQSHPGARTQTAEHAAPFALNASILAALLAASSAPTPLYPHYQDSGSLSALTITVVFSAYSLTLLLARAAPRPGGRPAAGGLRSPGHRGHHHHGDARAHPGALRSSRPHLAVPRPARSALPPPGTAVVAATGGNLAVIPSVAFGAVPQGALRMTLASLDEQSRATTPAAYSVLSYLSMSLPAIAATQHYGLNTAAHAYATAAALLAVAAVAALATSRRRTPHHRNDPKGNNRP